MVIVFPFPLSFCDKHSKFERVCRESQSYPLTYSPNTASSVPHEEVERFPCLLTPDGDFLLSLVPCIGLEKRDTLSTLLWCAPCVRHAHFLSMVHGGEITGTLSTFVFLT